MKLLSKNKAQNEMVAEIAQTVQEVQRESGRPTAETVSPVLRKVPLTHRTAAKIK